MRTMTYPYTPPCFGIYIAGEVFKRIVDMGGVSAMHEHDVQKANKLYEYIDSSSLYKAPVKKEDRSLMNVVFVTGIRTWIRSFKVEAGVSISTQLRRSPFYRRHESQHLQCHASGRYRRLIAFMKKLEEENK